jgi:hypothetical protein
MEKLMAKTGNFNGVDGFEKDELEFLKSNLDSEELFLLSFLKGFNRGVAKEWDKKGFWDFSIEADYSY